MSTLFRKFDEISKSNLTLSQEELINIIKEAVNSDGWQAGKIQLHYREGIREVCIWATVEVNGCKPSKEIFNVVKRDYSDGK